MQMRGAKGALRGEQSTSCAVHTSRAALLLTRSVVVIATAAWCAPSRLSSRLAASFGTAACSAWSLCAERGNTPHDSTAGLAPLNRRQPCCAAS